MIWIQKKPGGGWKVWLVAGEASEMERLPARLREILENPDFSNKVVERLFPRAFRDDPEAEADYQQLLRKDLLRQKLEGVEAFEKSLRSRKEFRLPREVLARLELGELDFSLVQLDLAEEELSLWLGFFHDLRLVIGTGLDITDESWDKEIDPRDPNAAEIETFHRLAYLEEAIIQALREAERLE